jgi:hypothetical protein
MDSFDLSDVLAEYSRSVRHSLISIESLHDVPGTDREKVNALAYSVRRAHAQTTAYIAALLEANAAAEAECCDVGSSGYPRLVRTRSGSSRNTPTLASPIDGTRKYGSSPDRR